MRAPKKAAKLVKDTGRKVKNTAKEVYEESGAEEIVDTGVEFVDDVASEVIDTISDLFGLDD